MMQEGHGHTLAIHLHLAAGVGHYVLGHAASNWGNNTQNKQLPTYLRFKQRRHFISFMMQEGHGHTLAIHLHLAASMGHCFGPCGLQLGELHAEPTAAHLFTLVAKTTFYIVHDAGRTWPYHGDPSSPQCGALFWATQPPTGGTTRWTNSCPSIYVFIKDDILYRSWCRKDMAIPWRSIFTSLPVWGIVLGHAASNWGNYTLNQQLPTYLTDVLRFDLSYTGLLSSMCYVLQWIGRATLGYK